MPEILLILAIALIVIGPAKLPELAKTLGRAMGEFKKSAQDFKRSIDMETTLHDINSASPDMKDVTRKSRQEKTGKNQKNPDQEKKDVPENGTSDNSDTAPDNDAADNGGSGDKKSK